jgi:metallo-beta-lactamase family protein
MAIDVTDIYLHHPEEHDLDMQLLRDAKRAPLRCREQRIVRTAQESKALNDRSGPMIIVSASGMATGGRVIHHLKARLGDDRTTVLLPGFQAAGTRGRALADGAREVRIHGRSVAVRATVVTLESYPHADRDELVRWLSGSAVRRNGSASCRRAAGRDTLAATIRARFDGTRASRRPPTRWRRREARQGLTATFSTPSRRSPNSA